jgi:hypothetical protein
MKEKIGYIFIIIIIGTIFQMSNTMTISAVSKVLEPTLYQPPIYETKKTNNILNTQ